MTEFGLSPINYPCPDCGVSPVDGYQTHLRSCPHFHHKMWEQSLFPMPEMDDDLKEGLEKDGSFWAPGHVAWPSELRDWARWKWRGIDWEAFWITVVCIAIGCVILWLLLSGLDSLEGGGR